MIRTQLQTERLRLRLFTQDDLPVVHVLNTDPDIIKYTVPMSASSRSVARHIRSPLKDEKVHYSEEQHETH
jgi:hypothetical protein